MIFICYDISLTDTVSPIDNEHTKEHCRRTQQELPLATFQRCLNQSTPWNYLQGHKIHNGAYIHQAANYQLACHITTGYIHWKMTTAVTRARPHSVTTAQGNSALAKLNHPPAFHLKGQTLT